jgi:hypothetical protein
LRGNGNSREKKQSDHKTDSSEKSQIDVIPRSGATSLPDIGQAGNLVFPLKSNSEISRFARNDHEKEINQWSQTDISHHHHTVMVKKYRSNSNIKRSGIFVLFKRHHTFVFTEQISLPTTLLPPIILLHGGIPPCNFDRGGRLRSGCRDRIDNRESSE